MVAEMPTLSAYTMVCHTVAYPKFVVPGARLARYSHTIDFRIEVVA